MGFVWGSSRPSYPPFFNSLKGWNFYINGAKNAIEDLLQQKVQNLNVVVNPFSGVMDRCFKKGIW